MPPGDPAAITALNAFWDWFVTWKGGAVVWAFTNVIVAQAASPDDLLSWGLTLAGVTVPFGVGWAWNRQWAESVRRQNEFLREQDLVLRQELVDERTEKLSVYETNDSLRRLIAQYEAETILAKAERARLESNLKETTERLIKLESVVQLRKSNNPSPPGGVERRKNRRDAGTP